MKKIWILAAAAIIVPGVVLTATNMINKENFSTTEKDKTVEKEDSFIKSQNNFTDRNISLEKFNQLLNQNEMVELNKAGITVYSRDDISKNVKDSTVLKWIGTAQKNNGIYQANINGKKYIYMNARNTEKPSIIWSFGIIKVNENYLYGFDTLDAKELYGKETKAIKDKYEKLFIIDNGNIRFTPVYIHQKTEYYQKMKIPAPGVKTEETGQE